MAQPYVGEIRMFGGNFAPAGWAFCEGQTLPISENDTLFALIGTTYGGDGQQTFNLPDLRGRVPVHRGAIYVLAQATGTEEVTLTVQQVPTHTHPMLAVGAQGSTPNPGNAVVPAGSSNVDVYLEDIATTPMAATAMTAAGGSQPHTNFQPYLCVNFIISLFGIYPSQT